MKKISISALISIALVIGILSGGCTKDEKKVIFEAHYMLGATLLSAQEQINLAFDNKVINESTYLNIKSNWLKASDIYVQETKIVNKILLGDKDPQTIAAFFASAEQINLILADITFWVKGDK